jgi:hypothetical protein
MMDPQAAAIVALGLLAVPIPADGVTTIERLPAGIPAAKRRIDTFCKQL